MAINKVVYGNDTLIDLTNDTATEDDVLEGVTFHDKSGSLRSGSLKPVLDVEVDGNSIVDQDGVANITSDNLSVIAKDLTENKTATVTDGVADFETIGGSLVKSLVVEIEPSQSGSGTPSPSNIRPITGWTQEDVFVVGKNWADIIQGGCATDGTITADSTRLCNSDYIPVEEGQSYTISIVNLTNKTVQGYFRTFTAKGTENARHSTGWFASPLTIDIESGEHYLQFIIRNSDNSNISPSDVKVVVYENSNGKTYTTPFNQTVYGGTLDVLTGELTIDKGFITLNGTENCTKSAITDCDIYLYTITLADFSQSFITSAFEYTTTQQNTVGRTWRGSSDTQIRIGYAEYGTSTVESFKTWLSQNPLQIAYTLATPTTVQLTPQTVKALVGENHISASTGNVLECKYSMLINGDDIELSEKSSIYNNAGAHNAIYRGKYLGSSVTAEQYSAINDGTFKDLFIGDYWTINGVNWRIAHFDYWLNTGDTTNCTTHHAVIVPDTNLYTAQMNAENVTTGGYYNSAMRGGANYPTGGHLANAKTAIDNAFGSSHILSHREVLTNAVSGGNASSSAWYDSTVDLMSEVMAYGTLAWSVGGGGHEARIDKEQLALFRHDHSRMNNRTIWWLRSVASAAQFAIVNSNGDAFSTNASTSRGVRPVFAIRGGLIIL